MDPFISVVVATRNRQQLLASTLEALLAQKWERFEIVVADNGSTDGTREVVASAARSSGQVPVRYAFVPRAGKSFAVNAALELAEGDLLALTDDDVRPEPDWLVRLAEAFGESSADFVAGRVLPLWETPPPKWMSAALSGVLAIADGGPEPEALDGTGRIMPIGANMAVRRSVVATIGGLRTDLGKLDGSLRTGEDHEFFLRMLRAGFRGVYAPGARVHHWVPAERLTRPYFRKWQYQNGRAVARLEASYVPADRRLLGVPRYRWREAAAAASRVASTLVAGDCATRFAAFTQVIWHAGYVLERWTGRTSRHERIHEGTPVAAISR
jgi:glycosyltransferase involved in cell wall biosynthesis